LQSFQAKLFKADGGPGICLCELACLGVEYCRKLVEDLEKQAGDHSERGYGCVKQRTGLINPPFIGREFAAAAFVNANWLNHQCQKSKFPEKRARVSAP